MGKLSREKIFKSGVFMALSDVTCVVKLLKLLVPLFQFPFAMNVWSLVMSDIYPLISWSSSPPHLFNNCPSLYQGSLKGKTIFKDRFMAIPKFFIWKIWLARNRAIFSEIINPAKLVASKCVSLMQELFQQKGQQTISKQQLTPAEGGWLE
jgi:hypothetical protein